MKWGMRINMSQLHVKSESMLFIAYLKSVPCFWGMSVESFVCTVCSQWDQSHWSGSVTQLSDTICPIVFAFVTMYL